MTEMSSDTSDRTRRLLFNQISRYLDKNTVQLVQQKVTIDKQTAIISDLNVRKSRKVKVDCNNIFPNVDSIHAAQQEAERRELAAKSRKFDQEAEKTAKIVSQKGMNNCIKVFDLLNGQIIGGD